MGIRLNHKLGLFAALSALAGTAVVASMAYLISSQVLDDSLRAQALSASSQLAMRVGEELKHLADRGRFYVSTSQRPAFEKDGELLAITVLRLKSDQQAAHTEAAGAHSDDGAWITETRWTLPIESPAYLSAGAIAAMDVKYPVDTARITTGQSDIFFARSRSTSMLRLAVPYGQRTESGYSQVLVIDAKLGKLQALFSHREGIFAFMTADRGQLVIASDAGHFGPGEDLSQLTLVTQARDGKAPHGVADYRETPQGGIQHAAYARVVTSSWSSSGLTVFAQVPQSIAGNALQPLAVGLTAAGLVFAVLLGLCIGWVGPRWAWAAGWNESEIKSTAQSSQRPSATAGRTTPVSAPGESTPATMAKMQDPEVRQAFSQGKVKLTGERMQAAVLHSHLHGIDQLSKDTDPEKLLRHLNAFHQKAMHAIESRQGIVDHMHGGSIIALWGIPKSTPEDVPHALQAAQEIRAAATSFGAALKKDGESPSRLAMGLHYGALAVGQVGTADRLEYSAVGEGLEIAGRIQEFAEQFGTDLLITGAAASRAGDDFATEQLTPGDDSTPELFELLEEGEPSLEDAA